MTLIGCTDGQKEESKGKETQPQEQTARTTGPVTTQFGKEDIERMENTRAVIETPFGKIELKFFPDIAPKHVESFIRLAKEGFYDGTTFHRVIPGFMIQGGDPNSKSPNRNIHGTGGPGYNIDAEFSDKPHERGILSMARGMDPNSAGSQFFIVVKRSPHLDGQYTAFGEVVSGIEAVDQIVSQKRDGRDNPNEPIPVKITIMEP
jgi:peptidyl-prolyl cis-trans isomerase B (cyclophilin B)